MRQLNNEQQKLVERNTKLVYYMIEEYFSHNLLYVDKEELIQEGMVALCNSAAYFDPSKGTKFSTYACKSIKKHLAKYLQKHYKKKLQNTVNFDDCLDIGVEDEYKNIDKDDLIKFLKRFLNNKEISYLIDYYYNRLSLEELSKKYGYKNKNTASSIRTKIIEKLSNNPEFEIQYKKLFT